MTNDAWKPLVDAVFYGDQFDCAVSFDEIHHYSRVKIDPEDLRDRLEQLIAKGVISKCDGFYCLPGREALATERPNRMERARALHQRARRVAAWLRHFPFVRGLYLTGSVAADHAEPDADVDLLIVVAEGRIASTFMQLAPISRVLSRELFCPNFYIAESHLAIPRHTHYVAREVAQARPLLGGGNPLMAANAGWVGEELPNAAAHQGSGTPRIGSPVQRTIEGVLGGRLGGWLEMRARRVAEERLRKHYADRGWEVPEAVRSQFDSGAALRFHASDRVAAVLAELESGDETTNPGAPLPPPGPGA